MPKWSGESLGWLGVGWGGQSRDFAALKSCLPFFPWANICHDFFVDEDVYVSLCELLSSSSAPVPEESSRISRFIRASPSLVILQPSPLGCPLRAQSFWAFTLLLPSPLKSSVSSSAHKLTLLPPAWALGPVASPACNHIPSSPLIRCLPGSWLALWGPFLVPQCSQPLWTPAVLTVGDGYVVSKFFCWSPKPQDLRI